MPLDRLMEIGEILQGNVTDEEVKGFAIDSKKVKKGDLFFALRGSKFDGHHFLNEVQNKGSVGAVVENSYKGPSFGLQLIRVPDVVFAMHDLARAFHKKHKRKIIGVTGSVGKTTTKEFIATLLSLKYRVAKTPGNANSQVGLPLSILNGEGNEEILVAEMGMTHPGEIERLVNIIPPDIAVVTKIGHAHIGFFSDGIQGIAREKLSIFRHPNTKIKVANIQVLDFMQEKEGVKTFGVGEYKADFSLLKGWTILEKGKETSRFDLPFEESSFLENFMAAASVARECEMEWEEIFKGAFSLQAIERRFEKLNKDGITFINDSYNASPEAVRCSIDALPKPGMGGKTVMIFGGMADLGKFSAKSHFEIAELALNKVDHLLLFGKECLPMLEVFTKAGRPVEFFAEMHELKESMEKIAKRGDVVLIKGKNTSQLWQLIE